MKKRICSTVICVLLFFGAILFAQTEGTVKWILSDGFESFPAIGSDGTLYAGGGNTFYALNPDGTEKWSFSKGSASYGPVFSTPAIGLDGTIYVGYDYSDPGLYAFNLDGSVKWFKEDIQPPLSIGSDGTIYVCAERLYALNPDGSEKWSSNINGAPPAIGADGTLYIGSDTGLYALNSDGTEKWLFADPVCTSSPAIDFDGTVYIGSDQGLYAVNSDGTEKWLSTSGANTYNYRSYYRSPIIGSDGTVYVGANEGFYALNPDGTEKWSSSLEGDPMLIDSDGTIYVLSVGGALHAVNPDGTEKWSLPGGYRIPTTISMGIDGTLLYAHGVLSAIHTGSKGLAQSPWPKYGQGAANRSNSADYHPNSPVAVVTTNTIYTGLGSTITLIGSPSYDPDGDELSYEWSCVKNPSGHNIILSDSLKAEVFATFPSYAGCYIFILSVSDNQDGISSQIVTAFVGMRYYVIENGTTSSPAIGPDGSVYVGSNEHLYALNRDCTPKWSFATEDDIYSSPVIGSDGTVYVGSSDDKLYAVNPDGTRKWAFDTNEKDIDVEEFRSSPAIGQDGTIYVGAAYKLYALNPDGTEKAVFTTGMIASAPAIGPDGTVYAGSWDCRLYALNPEGSEITSYIIGSSIRSSSAIGSDGTIYVSSLYKLHAVNPDGIKKWSYTTAGKVHSSPAIGSDGTIYVGSDDNTFYALNPDGTEKWSYTTGGGIKSSPAIGSDGIIYVGCSDRTLYAFNPDGTVNWSFTTLDGFHTSPNIASDGTLYIASHTSLYAIQTSSMGLADSPWPKFAADNQNSGRYTYIQTTYINELRETHIPKEYRLYRNYPNPFNPTTVIQYDIPHSAHVQLTIYDVMGRQVKTLINTKQPVGHYKISWDATDDYGKLASAGLYFCRMESGDYVKVIKLALVK